MVDSDRFRALISECTEVQHLIPNSVGGTMSTTDDQQINVRSLSHTSPIQCEIYSSSVCLLLSNLVTLQSVPPVTTRAISVDDDT
jgi:hypothetical protein